MMLRPRPTEASHALRRQLRHVQHLFDHSVDVAPIRVLPDWRRLAERFRGGRRLGVWAATPPFNSPNTTRPIIHRLTPLVSFYLMFDTDLGKSLT